MATRAVFCCIISCVAMATHCAPMTRITSGDDNTLIRHKRAEEIMFGNHQNAARVKKFFPASNENEAADTTDNSTVSTSEAQLDDRTPQATRDNETETEAILDALAQEYVDEKQGNSNDYDRMMEEELENVRQQAVLSKLLSEEAEAEGRVSETPEESYQHAEGSSGNDGDAGDKTDYNNVNSENENDANSENGKNYDDVKVSSQDDQQTNDSQVEYRRKRSGDQVTDLVDTSSTRRERSVGVAAMTAENMIARDAKVSEKSTLRSKRDLNTNEIDDLDDDFDAEDDNTIDGNDEESDDDVDDETDDGEDDEEAEPMSYLQQLPVERPLEYADLVELKPDFVTADELKKQLVRGILAEDAAEEAREDVLDALVNLAAQDAIAAAEEQKLEETVAETNTEAEGIPAFDESSLLQFSPIVHNGVRGYFIPATATSSGWADLKTKRSVQHESRPEQDDLIEVEVPDVDAEDKAAAYHRLYMLARALRQKYVDEDDDDDTVRK